MYSSASSTTEIAKTLEQKIVDNLENAVALENLYRKNKSAFKKAFDTVLPNIQNSAAAGFWQERLYYKERLSIWENKPQLIFWIVATLTTGILLKLPHWMAWQPDVYFQKNIGFIVFPAISGWYLWKNKTLPLFSSLVAIIYVLSAAFMHGILAKLGNDALLLAALHLPVFLWFVWGIAYCGNQYRDNEKRISFISFNADWLIMTGLLAIAGLMFSGITIGLFELIQLRIESIYAQHIAIWGLAGLPFISALLVQNNTQIVSKISPIIAKLFTPLVTVLLIAFLVSVIVTGKDPYNDRNFLLLFNLLLLVVMAIIFFNVSEMSKQQQSSYTYWLLLVLAVVTVIDNGIALSAIVFRLWEYGFSPNRIAVLGTNLLIFSNLIWIIITLIKLIKTKANGIAVVYVITQFLPVYGIWAAIVSFILPLLMKQ